MKNTMNKTGHNIVNKKLDTAHGAYSTTIPTLTHTPYQHLLSKTTATTLNKNHFYTLFTGYKNNKF